jgi:ribonuclease P protein subunit POP4
VTITARNLVRHELVGMSVHVVSSSDPGLVSRRGTVVDESKETIRLDTGTQEITLPKRVCVLSMTLPSGEAVNVDGRVLRGRPEERVKRSPRRKL